MNAPLSAAQVFLHLDYLGEAAAMIESFARIAQENANLGSSYALRHSYRQIYRIIHDAAEILQKLERAEAAASKAKERPA